MIRRIFIIAGVAFIFSLALFSGITVMLFEDMTEVVEMVKYIPLELRVMFFAGWVALLWALYNAVVS
jgi:uncharacterized membrane protein YgdD (TMEM256/DUF423 family)